MELLRKNLTLSAIKQTNSDFFDKKRRGFRGGAPRRRGDVG